MRKFNWSLLALLIAPLVFALYYRHLGDFVTPLFDEKFYLNFFSRGRDLWKQGHPPLGVVVIEAGRGLFANVSGGWRIFPLLAGSGGVALIYLLGLALGGPWVGILSALLLTFDPLYYLMSRLAMLDIFMTFCLLLFFWCYWKQWRWAGGLALGLAMAFKWPAFFVLGGFLLWSLGEGIKAKERIGALGARLFFGLILPLSFYWGILFLCMPGASLSSLWNFHREFFHHHWAVFPRQLRYSSRWWSWMIFPQGLPVNVISGENFREVSFINNPGLLWAGGLGLLYLAWRGVKKDLSGWWLPVWGFSWLYFPWALLKRAEYLFYLLPCLPMLYLGAGFLLERLGKGKIGKIAVGLFLLFTVVSFIFLYPALNYLSQDWTLPWNWGLPKIFNLPFHPGGGK